jgi:hypothetical protein
MEQIGEFSTPKIFGATYKLSTLACHDVLVKF